MLVALFLCYKKQMNDNVKDCSVGDEVVVSGVTYLNQSMADVSAL